MNTSLESAKAICAHLEEASALCDQSLRVVKANEGIGALQVYARLVGHFLGHSYTNILAPIWAEYPELEPESMKQPYQEPVASLSPESQAAIAAFLQVAAPALSEAEQGLAAAMSSKSLPFGGLPEVVQSVAAIEEFMQHPRFRDEPPAA